VDFDLSKPQKLLKESARQLLSRACKPARVRELMETDTAHDPALWQVMADQGWTGLIVPESHGGLGLGLVEVAVVAEEMGRACLPGPFLSNLFATALACESSDRRYVEQLATGEMKATVAVLDESANWNLDARRSRGRRMFVGDAAVADVILCVMDDGAVVPFEPAGVSIEAMRSMDETRKLYEVSFGRASGSLGIAPQSVQNAIDIATVALCAEMVGGMQWILETTVQYAKTRQQFGRPIGSFQAVQHQCADMVLMTESARSATYYAAWALAERDPNARLSVSIAKAYCSDAYREVANRGVQIHGGIGFTWEHDLQLYYKRAKSSETLFGDAAFHRERIATLIVDEMPRTAAVSKSERTAVAAS
jgi:alkylation response protein AidB-like acyl-CoA dehydrogenase